MGLAHRGDGLNWGRTMREDILDELLDPESDHSWKRAAGLAIRNIEDQTMRTNGRVTKLERFMWAVSGGVAVISAVIVPLFLKLVWE